MAAPTGLSSRRGPVAKSIAVAPAAGVGRASVSTAGLISFLSFRLSVPVSSVFPSVSRLCSVQGLFIVPVFGCLPTLSPAIMFIHPVFDDLWSTVGFYSHSGIRALHRSRPASWFFGPALGFEGMDRRCQTGVKLAVSSACLLQIDAHH